MLRTTLFVAALSLYVVGCSDTPPPSKNPAASETAQKSKELYEAMKRDSKKQLDEMDRQLSEWKTKVDNASGEVKTTLERRYNEMKKQRDDFADKVNEFGKATGDAWEQLKDGLESAGKSVSDAFKKAADEFK
jgi:vacuolar-type H+-ATPase subunit I/STV1